MDYFLETRFTFLYNDVCHCFDVFSSFGKKNVLSPDVSFPPCLYFSTSKSSAARVTEPAIIVATAPHMYLGEKYYAVFYQNYKQCSLFNGTQSLLRTWMMSRVSDG